MTSQQTFTSVSKKCIGVINNINDRSVSLVLYHPKPACTIPEPTWNSAIVNLTVKERIFVCLSACPLIFSTTAHPIDFMLGVCIAEGPRKCSVECEVV